MLETRLVKGSLASTVSSGCRGISVGVPTYGPGHPRGQAFQCGNKIWLGLGVWSALLCDWITRSRTLILSPCGPLGALSAGKQLNSGCPAKACERVAGLWEGRS